MVSHLFPLGINVVSNEAFDAESILDMANANTVPGAAKLVTQLEAKAVNAALHCIKVQRIAVQCRAVQCSVV